MPPVICDNPNFVSNYKVQDLKDLLELNSSSYMPTLINDDIILEGNVISSDIQGNFYKRLSIQNKEEGKGFQVELDARDLYIKFPLGQKVLIRANKLFANLNSGVLKIGQIFQYKQNSIVGRIPETLIDDFVFLICYEISLIEPKIFSSIADLMKDEYINTLITLENIQFKELELEKNYAEEDDSGDRKLQDSLGNEIMLRSSNFANFAHDSLPKGSGKITAILGKFIDHYQLYVRDLSDVEMNKDRFVVVEPPSTSVQFASGSTIANEETDATYSLEMNIQNPSDNNTTRVDVVLYTGDPSDIDSYETQTVVFPAGSSKNEIVEITITDDELVENDEDLVFHLKNISGGNNAIIGQNDSFTLKIQSGDTPVVEPPSTSVQFASGSTIANEETDATYSLEINIQNPSDNNTTRIDVVLYTGDPSDIDSYETQTVVFPAGSSKNEIVEITITDDELVENDEDLVFHLKNISGGNNAIIGQNDSFTLKIQSGDMLRDEQIQINEFHYDNDGGDKNEFVEIRIDGNKASQPSNLNAFSVSLYNGKDGKKYRTIKLNKLSKTCDDKHCYYVWETTPIQNGPDGIAIFGPSIKKFLSYEGSFTAIDGIVSGMISTDIGVSELKSTALGSSLQIDPTDNNWKLSTQNTKGEANRIIP